MSSKRRIYVSGPMSGMPAFNFPAFHAAAVHLRAAGFEVVNPAELNPGAEKPWADCMRVDIRALMDCDGVAVLPGWSRSKGASLEVHIARELGMPVRMVAGWVDLMLEAA